VRFEVEASPAPIEAVAARIEAALRNVIDNAASFAGEGGQVRVSARIREAMCVIEVRDTGPGIPPENLPRVFDRFFTDRSSGEGTGLGLSLTKAIIEAHGGTITAASPPEGGALFTILLPVVSHGVHTGLTDISRGA
jgi:two-component system sensor histidine kinase ChvG